MEKEEEVLYCQKKLVHDLPFILASSVAISVTNH